MAARNIFFSFVPPITARNDGYAVVDWLFQEVEPLCEMHFNITLYPASVLLYGCSDQIEQNFVSAQDGDSVLGSWIDIVGSMGCVRSTAFGS